MYVTLGVSECLRASVVNKVEIDLLLLVDVYLYICIYVCDAVTQSNNMLISIGKVFRFLIILSDVYTREIEGVYMRHPPLVILVCLTAINQLLMRAVQKMAN